jgi:hypothetical protein
VIKGHTGKMKVCSKIVHITRGMLFPNLFGCRAFRCRLFSQNAVDFYTYYEFVKNSGSVMYAPGKSSNMCIGLAVHFFFGGILYLPQRSWGCILDPSVRPCSVFQTFFFH